VVYEEGGLPALLPRKPGPRRAHKLSEEVIEALRETLGKEPDSNATALAEWVEKRFGISIHPRSIERALARQEKKRRP
jgi:transposase